MDRTRVCPCRAVCQVHNRARGLRHLLTCVPHATLPPQGNNISYIMSQLGDVQVSAVGRRIGAARVVAGGGASGGAGGA